MAKPRSPKRAAPPIRHTDVFRIRDGALGPVPRCTLDIRPFTVFIGRQGTGKSLVAQVLYFLEELPFLVAFIEGTQRKAKQWSPQHITSSILDQLRSSQRNFTAFANPKVQIDWERSAPYEWPGGETRPKLTLRASKNKRLIDAPPPTWSFIDHLREAGRERGTQIPHYALFIPTERIVSSQLHSAIGSQLLSVPLTFTLFEEWLEQASLVASQWMGGKPASETARRIAQVGQDALGGHAERKGDQWKWRFSAGKRSTQLDIDMASSGQRANWPIPYIAQALFDLRDDGEEAATLFVEEPEIHLHPSAQVEMVRILSMLVHEGFRVVLTTHSLNVIYALNNFIQASRLGDTVEEGVPEPEVRLKPQDVSVYAFTGGAPRQLVDVEAAFIDERELGWVSEELAAGLNRIGALTLQQEEP
ncbi:ATP-binding protein [Archangium gephyra]|nr:ATP-binding protein [Archangium gephyra]